MPPEVAQDGFDPGGLLRGQAARKQGGRNSASRGAGERLETPGRALQGCVGCPIFLLVCLQAAEDEKELVQEILLVEMREISVVVPDNSYSASRLIFPTICIKLPASNNPLFGERIPHHDAHRACPARAVTGSFGRGWRGIGLAGRRS